MEFCFRGKLPQLSKTKKNFANMYLQNLHVIIPLTFILLSCKFAPPKYEMKTNLIAKFLNYLCKFRSSLLIIIFKDLFEWKRKNCSEILVKAFIALSF